MKMVGYHQMNLSEKIKAELAQTVSRVMASKGGVRAIAGVEETKDAPRYGVVHSKYGVAQRIGQEDALYGYRMLPMVAPKFHFELSKIDLEMIDEGLLDFDVSPLEAAVEKLMGFEEGLLLHGAKDFSLPGLLEKMKQSVISTKKDPESIISAILQAAILLRKENVLGPYRILMGKDMLLQTSQLSGGTTLAGMIEEELGTEILVSDTLKGALLMPQQSPDILLHLGSDIGIGVESITPEGVRFYLTELVSTQILNEFAAVKIELSK